MSDEHGSDFVDELMEFLLRNYYSMRKISLPKP